MKHFNSVSKKFPHILYGGDYNPEQWKDMPKIWDEDMRLMELAHCNCVSLGIFSWSEIEPEEGRYDFSVMDTIMDKLAKNGQKVFLATPSGARPAWMSEKYPQILRTDEMRIKHLHGFRHNHCYTAPIYRKKTAQINRILAERYKNHPALIAWHVSNEYGGECHCELCQEAFREWLRKKYDNDLKLLNKEWWTAFWSHTYTSWEQITSPGPLTECNIHGLNLDWKRFVTDQTIDFMKNEIKPIREITPDIPVTTNFMGFYTGLNYFKFKDIVDFVSWDTYPGWHHPTGNIQAAASTAMAHDLNRSIKAKPFVVMENTPSCVNWSAINQLKKPNMNILSGIQSIAHGSDSVLYFQWRKSRGSSEKFHGAVVDHCGHENTRVFREVAKLGNMLNKMDGVTGSETKSEVALIYDWENRWAIDDMQALQKDDKKYLDTCLAHYKPFWESGVSVDIIDETFDFDAYKVVVAPMLYMMKPGVIEKIKDYVKKGGRFITTYITGQVNENDLCYLGGFPAEGLKEVFGIWAEETQTLYPEERNAVTVFTERLPLQPTYTVKDYCDLIHSNTAQVLAEYQNDFYKGMPACTVNSYGEGEAYYIAFRDDGDFTGDFYRYLMNELKLKKALNMDFPKGVTATCRETEEEKFVFVQNYNGEAAELELPDEAFFDFFDNEPVEKLKLNAYGCVVLKQTK